MTKRKAVEAAYSHAAKTVGYVPSQIATVVDAVADHAYEAGRIAGLREAAMMIPSRGTVYGWLQKSEIRDHASILAKKAREK